ncbi:MAG: hypothetical protein JWO86_1178, partial [Myxococcaceae bacterium]|nr:hypothetical protein [Myxococcaceae bacterium]
MNYESSNQSSNEGNRGQQREGRIARAIESQT